MRPTPASGSSVVVVVAPGAAVVVVVVDDADDELFDDEAHDVNAAKPTTSAASESARVSERFEGDRGFMVSRRPEEVERCW